jgi:iron complex outermembrane receptor protein
VARYKESRAGISDMQYGGGTAMFSSSNTRIYIDNQELNSATFGSGFVSANNLSLSFVDHVEIYTRAPSYEFSTEPTYILIKLYSKVAQRDRGTKVDLSLGSRGFNQESIFYADELKDYSYVASVTRLNDERKSYSSHDIPIKRDSDGYTIFASLYNKEHKLQLMAGKADMDTAIARSPRATYDISTGYYDYLNVGYETSYFDNILFSTAYQHTDISGKNREKAGYDVYVGSELDFDRSESVLTTELKQTVETDKNRLITGVKFRHKSFTINEAKVDGFSLAPSAYDMQNIYSVFAEERYSISDYNILSISAQYSRVDNNGDINDADLFQLRLNHTYLYDEFVFKSSAYRIESLVEPYIYLDFPTAGSLKPQLLKALSEEIKYSYANGEFRFVITCTYFNDKFIQSNSGGFINNTKEIKHISGFLEHTYAFDINNKITSNISHVNVDEVKNTAAFIRVLNTVGKFDIFNEIIYDHSNINHNNYYDYSAGVKYHHDKNLIFSIKGENIFDKAYEESYFRIDPDTLIAEEPIMISPIEQRFFFTVEYLF